MRTFLETDFSSYQGYVIILDVDGVLVPDGVTSLDERVCQQVARLGQVNDVYLCSNGGHTERDKRFAALANVTWLSSSAGKPSLRAVEDLAVKDQPVLVVGDKVLTDGLLAHRLRNASFVKVKRLVMKGAGSIFNLNKLVEFGDDVVGLVLAAIKIVRPVQHIRNLLILAPAFFASQLFLSGNLMTAFISIIMFSSLVGFVYIVNDIIDYDSDLQHPVKRKRPLTSGLISKQNAFFVALLLLSVAIALCYLFVPDIWWLMAAYGLLNILYSVLFKHIVVLDILTIAIFYLIRILIGGVVFNVSLSAWLILTTFFLALFLVIGKRKSEAQGVGAYRMNDRHSLSLFFDMLLIVAVTVSLVSYGIYTVLEIASPLAPYTNVLAVYILFKYLYVLNTMSIVKTPEQIIISQPDIILTAIAWLGLMGYILYV